MVLLKNILNSNIATAMLVTVVVVATQIGGMYLTKNQILAQQLVETKRANTAQEQLTLARDQANAKYQLGQLELGRRNAQEAERANRERERYNVLALNESSRHNLATEAAELSRLAEQSRHNVRSEEQTDLNLREQARANAAREALGTRQQAEIERSNRANEQLNTQRNVETQRSNLANEALQSERNYVSLNSLYEQQRANREHERIQLLELNQNRELKQQELADRYFWTDKVNTLLNNLMDTNPSGIGGIINEKGIELQQRINDTLNRGETLWRQKIIRPASEFLKEEVAPTYVEKGLGLLERLRIAQRNAK